MAARPEADLWSRFEELLEAQRQALITGNLPGLEQAGSALRALLTNSAWRAALRDHARPSQLKLAQAQLDLNAQLSARAQASTHRALACMARTPAVYTVAGGLQSASSFNRRVKA
jgi:hypothetical protein